MTASALMLRSATRKALTATDRAGKKWLASTSRSWSRAAEFSTKTGDDITGGSDSLIHPVPLPAVAYDYEDDDYEVEGDTRNTVTSFTALTSDKSKTPRVLNTLDPQSSVLVTGALKDGRGPTMSNPYPAPSSIGSKTAGPIRKVGSGGGGGNGSNLRPDCPKCGATVTFRCDFEENTYYCASCSGWFVANPSTILGKDGKIHDGGSVYDEFIAKTGGGRKQDMMMRRVSPSRILSLASRAIHFSLLSLFFHNYTGHRRHERL